MALQESKRNRILEFSFERFTTVGINNITMEEIAKGLGMGKGTLYQYFPSKEELLYNTIRYFAGQIENSVQEIVKEEKVSTVEKLNAFYKLIGEKFALLNPVAIENITKSYPQALLSITEIRSRVITII